jgi:hypothetical protein
VGVYESDEDNYFMVDKFLEKRIIKSKIQYLVKFTEYTNPEWVEATLLRHDLGLKYYSELVHALAGKWLKSKILDRCD